jgi:hypothetical protein
MSNKKYTLSQVSIIGTQDAKKYLQRLCKHFQHKVDVQHNKDNALIQFEEGICAMQFSNNTLHMGCKASNTDDLKAITDTMDRHITALFRDNTLTVHWNNTDATYLVNPWT